MYKLILTLFLATFMSLVAAQDIKAVYHVTTGIETASATLNNIKNHLDADSKTRIVVVSNGQGIDFMLQDAKDSKGREFSSAVSTLVGRGVEFRVCNNTLTTRNISPSKLLTEAKVVPSGVSEVAKLQAKEGFVYIKP
jgi:uncharacterized protein